jgi:peroxiredoxin Q/BCP
MTDETNINATTSQSRLEINTPVADFFAPATSGKDIRLSACLDYHVVLYFYPKDDTPGCTCESQDFTSLYSEFKAEKAIIFGISRDTLKSHEKFKAKFEFPFELISDQDQALCTQFQVLKEKNMYGKKVIGIERSTFLIDKTGLLKGIWRNVKVEGHAQEVLDSIKALNQNS